MRSPRVLIIGLDSMPPYLAFELLAERMPTLTRLRKNGAAGPLLSTDPPVTIPAWVTMVTGEDPGELGIYGFRNRQRGSYQMRLVGSRLLEAPRIWELAASRGLVSVVVGVPLTYPPRGGPRDAVVSGFLTPDSSSPWIFPETSRRRLESAFGPYIVDVEGYREGDRRRLLQGAERMTAQHFGIFRELIREKQPDFAMIVDLSPDRLHHGLLDAIDPKHPLYRPGDSLTESCLDYYEVLDNELASTLELAGPDTLVLIVSDHGVQPLKGAFAINEWLMSEGFLSLRKAPPKPVPLSRADVDWSRTRAFGEGGHHCRICLNIEGREPEGIVPEAEAADLIDDLGRRIEKIQGPDGRKMNNRLIVPSNRYKAVRGLPPDLIVYFDDLALRCIAKVGGGRVFETANDTGYDVANHHREGIAIAAGAVGEDLSARIASSSLDIEDIFTVSCARLGIDVTPH